MIRSPPCETNLKTPPMDHYSSDSAINSSLVTGDQSDNFHNITKRYKRSFSEFNTYSSADPSEIKSIFAEIRAQQDQKFEALTSALSTIITQNQDIQKSVDFMTGQYEGMLSKVSCLEN